MVYYTIVYGLEIQYMSSDITKIDRIKEELKQKNIDFKIYSNIDILGIKELVYEFKNGVELNEWENKY